MSMNTTIGIIGGGPSGLLLSCLLDRMGIENTVLEHRSRERVAARVRAGQLDHASVDYLRRVGLGVGLDARGLPQRGMNLRFSDRTRRLDLEALTDGAYCTVYGQSDLTRELMETLAGAGHSPLYEVGDVRIAEPATLLFQHEGAARRLDCDYVIGCDGALGVARAYVNGANAAFSRCLPFSWMGLLSETPPISNELTYVYHSHGFALWSMRSLSVSRTYLQCGRDDTVEDWSDDRFWTEFSRRMGPDVTLDPGPTTERVMVQMQGYVASVMRRGRVVLAGDAGHVAPPSAAKGLNMAIADVAHLVEALKAMLSGKDRHALDRYAEGAAQRAWAGQYLSWRMTDLLHAPPDRNPFENEIKLTRLNELVASRSRLRDFCEHYVGKELLA
ncbi:MAG: 4-hydroxybenzoate 3-monooxygenase [Pikeienuella sp.]